MKLCASRLSVLPQRGFCPNGFWSSDKLTGSQPGGVGVARLVRFWSSDKLTGSQPLTKMCLFIAQFWSSDKLTGSQPFTNILSRFLCFGAVTN